MLMLEGIIDDRSDIIGLIRSLYSQAGTAVPERVHQLMDHVEVGCLAEPEGGQKVKHGVATSSTLLSE